MSEWVHVEVERIVKRTDKALLVVVDEEENWLPLSQISPADREQYDEGDENVTMCVSPWIAEQKGFS